MSVEELGERKGKRSQRMRRRTKHHESEKGRSGCTWASEPSKQRGEGERKVAPA